MHAKIWMCSVCAFHQIKNCRKYCYTSSSPLPSAWLAKNINVTEKEVAKRLSFQLLILSLFLYKQTKGSRKKNLHSQQTCPIRGEGEQNPCPLRKCKFLLGKKIKSALDVLKHKKMQNKFNYFLQECLQKITSYFLKY